MKKLIACIGFVLTLASCTTPQPTSTPEGTDTMSTMRTDTTMRDTTVRDTTQLKFP